MLVQQILSSKPSQDIITVAPGSSIKDAVALLSEKRIGAVIVSEDGRTVVGILSERDIVRELGKQGAGCLKNAVATVMTSRIVGCSPGDSARQVMQKMSDGRFRHMPVMDGDTMIGFISIGDVVKARLSELAMENDALEGMIKGY